MKTPQELISDLNKLRASMKTSFSNVKEMLSYNKWYAEQHRNIMHAIANACGGAVVS